MPILHVQKNTNYTVMSNRHLQDKTMSLKAKGLLSMMLSFNSESWEWSLAGLAAMCKDGIDSVREGLRELTEKGYFFKGRARNDHGQLGKAEYWVFEEPQDFNSPDFTLPGAKAPLPISLSPRPSIPASVPSSDADEPVLDLPILENPILANPIQEKPIQAEPVLENPPQINTKRQNTEKEINTNPTKYQSHPSSPSNQPDSDHIDWDGIEDQMDRWNHRDDEHSFSSSQHSKAVYKGMTVEQTRNHIRELISYDSIIQEEHDPEMVDELVEIMMEILVSVGRSFKTSDSVLPYEIAADRVESYDYWKMRYLIRSLERTPTEIFNVHQYLITAILNNAVTIVNKTESQFRKDFPDFCESRKGRGGAH